MARPPYSRPFSLGTGQIESRPKRTLVHFGSPDGTKYSEVEPVKEVESLDSSWNDIEFFQNKDS